MKIEDRYDIISFIRGLIVQRHSARHVGVSLVLVHQCVMRPLQHVNAIHAIRYGPHHKSYMNIDVVFFYNGIILGLRAFSRLPRRVQPALSSTASRAQCHSAAPTAESARTMEPV